MFARKLISGSYQLFHDDGDAILKLNCDSASTIYPVNNHLLSACYSSSDGEAFILTPEDFDRLNNDIGSIFVE